MIERKILHFYNNHNFYQKKFFVKNYTELFNHIWLSCYIIKIYLHSLSQFYILYAHISFHIVTFLKKWNKFLLHKINIIKYRPNDKR